jgi:hypothetical protein
MVSLRVVPNSIELTFLVVGLLLIDDGIPNSVFLTQSKVVSKGHWLAVPQLRRFVAGFSLRRPGFELGTAHVGYVVHKVALVQVFSEYFCFPCHSFHRLFHIHHHPPSGASTVGQTLADVPSGLSVALPKENVNGSTVLRSIIFLKVIPYSWKLLCLSFRSSILRVCGPVYVLLYPIGMDLVLHVVLCLSSINP